MVQMKEMRVEMLRRVTIACCVQFVSRRMDFYCWQREWCLLLMIEQHCYDRSNTKPSPGNTRVLDCTPLSVVVVVVILVVILFNNNNNTTTF